MLPSHLARRPHPLARAAIAAAWLAFTSAPALAVWSADVTQNNPVCLSPGNKETYAVVPDGAGGFVAAWGDYRAGDWDVYAMRITRDGDPAPGWTIDGIPVCNLAGAQFRPALAPDGTGGFLVAWTDYRGASADIYLQRLTGSGAISPGWPAGGLQLTTVAFPDDDPVIVPDGTGGALVFWNDFYDQVLDHDIFGQRVTAAGVRAWGTVGFGIDQAAAIQTLRSAIPDDAGGAIIAYEDRVSGSFRVHVRRVLPSGLSAWDLPDVTFGEAVPQSSPYLARDGAGGALVMWDDGRPDRGTYAQRLSAAGARLWPIGGGVRVAYNTDPMGLTGDGAGGGWAILGNGMPERVQRVTGGGASLASWAAGPTFSWNFGMLGPVPDSFGGAILAGGFGDFLDVDVVAAHLNSTGATAAGWPAGGRVISDAFAQQYPIGLVPDGADGAIVVFLDLRGAPGDQAIYAQRFDRFGELLDARPGITSVGDVRPDQGGRIRVEWTRSALDTPEPGRVSEYRVWRQTPVAQALKAQQAGALFATSLDDPGLAAALREGRRVFLAPTLDATAAWEYIATQPARGFASYAAVIPTLADSTPTQNPRTRVFVEARSSDGAFWDSPADSGYSVDDLPPGTPANLAGLFGGGATRLTWDPNLEPDLAEYRIYRGTSAAFVPGAGSLLAAQPDTGYVDPGGAPFYYKVSAVDLHGNESAFALLTPAGTVDVARAATPAAVWMAAPLPNPARGPCTLRFALPRAAPVSLGVFDVQGRCVRWLARGAMAAGEHTLGWDGRDPEGRAVPNGLYLVRLQSGGETRTGRLVMAR